MEQSEITMNRNNCQSNINVTGNNNKIVTDSVNTNISDTEDRGHTHWLQLVYWVIGILGTLSAIYFGFVK